MERLNERRKGFLLALVRLEEANNAPFSSFVRDAVILRFKFTHELAIKMLQLRLEQEGIEAKSPRETWQKALQAGLATDGNLWSDLQKMRNLTSHTYNEKLADEVYTFIRATGLGHFQQLAEQCRTWQPKA